MGVGWRNNMRPGFERALRQYGDVIKDVRKTEKGDQVSSDVDLQKLETVADYFVSKRSSELDMERGTQSRIFDLQKEKQIIMEQLKARLRDIDDPHAPEVESSKDALVAHYDVQKNNYTVTDFQGRVHEVTLGEMVADVPWGLSYLLRKDAPRVHQKQYAVAQAKEALMSHLDRQICLEERERKDHAPNIHKGAYAPFVQKLEGASFPEHVLVGWWAEEMVCGFLTRLVTDGMVDVEVHKADVYEDINHKIDFSIRRQRHIRGVDTQVIQKGVGIQFTLLRDREKLQKKQRQVEEARGNLEQMDLDDLVLVHISIGSKIIQSVRQWKEAGEPPGGPMRFWSVETRRAILRGVLQNLFSPEELQSVQEAMGDSSEKKKSAKENKKVRFVERIQEISGYLTEEMKADEVLMTRALEVLGAIHGGLPVDHPKREKIFLHAAARLVRKYRADQKQQKLEQAA